LPPTTPELGQAALTHAASTVAVKGAMNYDQLEWTGDSVVYFLASELISKTFGGYNSGRSTHARERLVCNKTLASYFRRYELDKRANFPPEFYPDKTGQVRVKHSTREKVEGDMFEAYIGAVLRSDPAGYDRCYQWLKTLWAGTLATDLRKLDRNAGMKLIEEGGGKKSVDDIAGAKERLSNLIRVPGVRLVYEDLPHKPQHQHNKKITLFAVRLVLNGYGEQGIELGFGSGLSKNEAGEKAAIRALENKKLMKKYQELKRSYVEAKQRNMQAETS
jgi:ribonuclease-3